MSLTNQISPLRSTDRILADYRRVRVFSERIIEPLSAEDCAIQSMPDVSPTRWHLAHTTWFFETFVLKPQPNYQVLHESFQVLFNSYYNAVGEQFPRAKRGLLSRPTLQEILCYRTQIDELILELLEGDVSEESLRAIELGLHHEQQHQELMLTDIKHVLSSNPLHPVYRNDPWLPDVNYSANQTQIFEESLVEIGHRGSGFAFDNECPRHRVFLEQYGLQSRLVTNGDYFDFMREGGYRRPEFWLSMGWNHVVENRWQAPLYWQQIEGEWFQFTLGGLQRVLPDFPVCHISYFEADAFARWAGQRLPTEFEWETAASKQNVAGHFADELLACRGDDSPQPASHLISLGSSFRKCLGVDGQPICGLSRLSSARRSALGEYNGKFTCNQFVLRGGSCATPSGHVRCTYRNFFPPETRWQFSGIRLAR